MSANSPGRAWCRISRSIWSRPELARALVEGVHVCVVAVSAQSPHVGSRRRASVVVDAPDLVNRFAATSRSLPYAAAVSMGWWPAAKEVFEPR